MFGLGFGNTVRLRIMHFLFGLDFIGLFQLNCAAMVGGNNVAAPYATLLGPQGPGKSEEPRSTLATHLQNDIPTESCGVDLAGPSSTFLPPREKSLQGTLTIAQRQPSCAGSHLLRDVYRPLC